MLPNVNNQPQETALFSRIDDIVNRVNTHQTPALAANIAARSKWSQVLDLSDRDILKKCIELIAYSQQAQALRVTGLIDSGVFDKVFLNYDIQAVANLKHEQVRDQYWVQIGAIRFPQKLEAMIGCAQALLRIQKEHASFMTYLRALKIPVKLQSQSDIDVFWREFATVQQYLQQIQMPFFENLTSLCHLLMTLGYVCIKPDSAVMSAAVKLGLVSSGSNSKKPKYNDTNRKDVVKAMQAYCLSRGMNSSVLDGYLLIYGEQTGAKVLVTPQFYQQA